MYNGKIKEKVRGYNNNSEHVRITHEITTMKEKIKENKDKVKVNKTLPYLVANVIELLDVDGEDQEEDGANVDLDAQVRFHMR